MRALMIGAGAIGGITAALIKEKGYDITLVCKYPELPETIEKKGLHIFGFSGDRRIKVPSVVTIDELTGHFDVVFIATKATELKDVATQILPYLTSNSRVVSMQNGIVEEELAKIVGIDRTVGCVVGFGATMHKPGVLEQTSEGEMIIGYIDRGKDGFLPGIAEMMSAVVPTIITDKILSHLYSKLIVNSGSSTLGAITGLDLGPMLKRKRARKIFIAIAEEAVNVADAMKLNIVPYSGKVNWYKIARGPRWMAHLIIYIIGMKYKRLKSSSLQSLERGRKTEVDIFNGYIAGKGKEFDVDTPVNRKLTQMVHEIERKKRPISPVNIDDDFFDAHI